MKLKAKEIALYRRMTSKKWLKKTIFLFAFLIVIMPIVLFFSIFFTLQVPDDFVVNSEFEIEKGMGVSEIANLLEDKKFIRSAAVFKGIYYLNKYKNHGVEDKIPAGHYVFKVPLNIVDVYEKLKIGAKDIKIKEVPVTILEGWPNFKIAEEVSKVYDRVSKEKFLKLAKEHEGFLYPSTYQFSKYDVSEEIIINKMLETFEQKTKDIKAKVDKSDSSWEKIIIMASIIEAEAGSAPYQVKRKVSGVLWKRIARGMPLQVDAFVDYVLQKHISKKLYSHLKIDSPYNTYINTGLTPTAIGNPSLDSIRAAFWPNKTGDLYYLTGKDGKFYFSKTNAQHLKYKDKYITNYVPEVKKEKLNDQ